LSGKTSRRGVNRPIEDAAGLKAKMKKLQVQLTEAQVQDLKKLADESGTSVAELVRQAVDAWLRAAVADREERKRRALAITGRFSSAHHDLSTAHDDHLISAFEE
jgi:hypothetical protein